MGCPVAWLQGSALGAEGSIVDGCHDRDIQSPCTLLSDRIHAFAVRFIVCTPFSVSFYLFLYCH